MIECPLCKSSAYLYKEILPDGQCKIQCTKIMPNGQDCNWVGIIVDHHVCPEIKTMKEIKSEWR